MRKNNPGLKILTGASLKYSIKRNVSSCNKRNGSTPLTTGRSTIVIPSTTRTRGSGSLKKAIIRISNY